jgi:hypothetical protein
MKSSFIAFLDAVRAPRKEPGDEGRDVDRHPVGTKSRRDMRYHQVGKLNNSHERSPLKGCMYADYQRSKERKRRNHFHQGKVPKYNYPTSERLYNKESHTCEMLLLKVVLYVWCFIFVDSDFDQKMDGKRLPTRLSGNTEAASHGNRHPKIFRDEYK